MHLISKGTWLLGFFKGYCEIFNLGICLVTQNQMNSRMSFACLYVQHERSYRLFCELKQTRVSKMTGKSTGTASMAKVSHYPFKCQVYYIIIMRWSIHNRSLDWTHSLWWRVLTTVCLWLAEAFVKYALSGVTPPFRFMRAKDLQTAFKYVQPVKPRLVRITSDYISHLSLPYLACSACSLQALSTQHVCAFWSRMKWK